MLENISAGTCLHLLSQIEDKTLDQFWNDISTGKYPIIDLQGNLGYSFSDEEGLQFVRNNFTPTSYTGYEFVFGHVFLPDTIQELFSEDKVLLLMVYNKTTQNLLLCELNVDRRYMIDLPRGQYSFFALLLDAEAKTLLDSTIYAIGLPCKGDLNNPELENYYIENPVDIEDFIDPAPIDVLRGGPFYVSLIMIDINRIPDCQYFISDILQGDEQQSPLRERKWL
jgi:hypothetical protein